MERRRIERNKNPTKYLPMQKGIQIASKISKDLEKNWMSELQEYNLHKIFEPIFRLNVTIADANTLVCAILYSYSAQSKWLDLKSDGASINKNVLLGLGADVNKEIFQEFICLSNDDITDTIGAYLDTQSDWKFCTIRRMIDFHAKTMNQKEPNWSLVDEEKKPKVLENMSRAMNEGVRQREASDKLIEQIERDYVALNHKTESDFGMKFTDNATKSDILSWRTFIKKVRSTV